MGLISDLFSSNGLKRTVASLLAVAACVSDAIPVLVPYKEALLYLAGLFGAVGVSHAALSQQPKKAKK